MNAFSNTMYGVLGGTFGIVIVTLALVYLSPFAGSASTGVDSTGNLLTNLLPFLAAIIAGGFALLALDVRRRR